VIVRTQVATCPRRGSYATALRQTPRNVSWVTSSATAVEPSVAQVASASGYNNMSNFNRQFLSEVGMTPSAYPKLDPTQKPPAPTTRTGTKAQPPS
jgi:AraC-like DNA-binding protein